MNHEITNTEWMDLMVCPVFCVRNHTIVKVNRIAAGMLLETGTSVDPLFLYGRELYDAGWEGTLYVTLTAFGTSVGASVIHSGDLDIFTLESPEEAGELQALSLAAMELRAPMTEVMASAAHIRDESEYAGMMKRGLFQLLRIIGNMSDASSKQIFSRLEYRNVDSLLWDIFEKAGSMIQINGIHLEYEGPDEDVVTAVDPQLLERAVLNILSNCLKFTPKGGSIRARLTKSGQFLHLQITDTGSGIPDEILHSLYRRHLRQPTIEDPRHGIGLGLLIVRNAAEKHGGAVLIDHPRGFGTRVTMTIAIRQSETMRQTGLWPDYAGELDHTLIELSENLDPSLY